jgi:aminocarboxymuconate-semialdehyde decarboxylase
MLTRRSFLRTTVAGAAGVRLGGSRDLQAAARLQDSSRRQVRIAGRPIKVIDLHGHAVMPVSELVKGTPLFTAASAAETETLGPERLRAIDRHGIDVQVLSVNGYWWYGASRDLAQRIVAAQNQGLAAWVAAHPDRFVGLASVAMQYPDLAVEQLEDGIKRLQLRGVSIGGHVAGEDLSSSKFDPFWARAVSLGALVFVHPSGATNIVKEGVLAGRGDLVNIIGNPLETTYALSRLIFDGTLDKFPGLRIAAAHAGGYLPSYLGRTDAACAVRPTANCANAKTPRQYLTSQVLFDTMVFSDEGLRHLVAEVGVRQIVFGTDLPFNWPVTVDLVLNARFLSDADKQAILGGNLMQVLRIDSRV